MLQAEEEKDLVLKCLQGDAASQKKLFDIYSAKMYAVCLRYASDSDLAKDFLQEGFIRVFHKLEQFRFEGSFEGWMRRVFVTTALEFCRKQVKSVEETGIENYENLGFNNKILEKLNLQDLLKLISSLPTGYRTVFNLFVIEGYSHQEIARELKISENTSKTQLRKARLLLMSKIKNG
ncbi:MAG: RNA polymerase sigma factor [Bacteroidia bacterium]|nr:RNA polymerase sigma factor [Bacteroidia bacterium]MCO5253764.1 RNA polymerase sigma factor [Bacteroidota bacterium]MCZ2130818.1 RNA polymerase sigma factor [Bacteroidia bacterium]